MQLKKEELLELFKHSVDNAYTLFLTAKKIALDEEASQKYPALGLAELALEELGKSYSCLAQYSISDELKDWKQFWVDWKKHDVKAHRAFFYELFSVTRIEIEDPELNKSFPTLKNKFSQEKEFAFYVDIDKGNRKILIPKNEISDVEVIGRVVSLWGLFNSALYIVDWMISDRAEEFKNAISDYAYRTLNTEMYQQDVENVIKSMKSSSVNYNDGLESILNLFLNSQAENG